MLVVPRTRRRQRGFGTAMSVLAWLTFLVLIGLFFQEVLQEQRNPNRDPESRRAEGGATEVVLLRNKFGHYVTRGQINDQSVVFMVDTGATGVAVPAQVARSLGLERGRPVTTQTANGRATAYVTTLDSVKVGDIEIRDVAASIAPGLQMDEILLGMSFLRHIEFTQKGRTLILRQN